MTPKESKRQKPRKSKPSEAGVMGSLSSERPARIGGRRDSAPRTAEKPPSARTAPTTAAEPPRAKTAPKPSSAKTTTKPPSAKTAPKPTSAKATPKPARAKTAAAPKPPRAQPEGPTPVRAGAPGLDDAAPPSTARTSRIPAGAPRSGTELASTVVHAAGELAQIGLTVGGQVLKRAVGRLPRR